MMMIGYAKSSWFSITVGMSKSLRSDSPFLMPTRNLSKRATDRKLECDYLSPDPNLRTRQSVVSSEFVPPSSHSDSLISYLIQNYSRTREHKNTVYFIPLLAGCVFLDDPLYNYTLVGCKKCQHQPKHTLLLCFVPKNSTIKRCMYKDYNSFGPRPAFKSHLRWRASCAVHY